MLSLFTLVALFFAATLGPVNVEARPIPFSVRLYRRFTFQAKPPPKQWAAKQLEDYDTYHFRYLDLGCHLQHSTDFFDACCHPRRNSQSAADYPAQCSLAPDSLAAAAKIVESSTGKDGAKVSDKGAGEGVFVQTNEVASLQAIKVDGKASTEPPTAAQLKAIIAAQKALTAGTSPNAAKKPAPDSYSAATTYKATSTYSASSNYASSAAAAAKASASAAAAATEAEKEKEQQQASAAAAEAEKQKQAQEQAQQQKQQQQQQQQQKQQQQQQQQQQKQQQSSGNGNGDGGDGGDGGNGGGGALSGLIKTFGQGGGAHATFFFQNGNPGACGGYHSDDTPLIALPTDLYAGGSSCGKTVKILNTANGKSVTATVQDECPTCTTWDSIDLSTGAYDQIGARETGELPIIWGFTS